MFLDFRGRMYVHSPYLSYQGNDLARALISFREEQILDTIGVECLLAYTANVGGFGKLSLTERKERIFPVLNSFKNVSEMISLASESKEPWQWMLATLIV